MIGGGSLKKTIQLLGYPLQVKISRWDPCEDGHFGAMAHHTRCMPRKSRCRKKLAETSDVSPIPNSL